MEIICLLTMELRFRLMSRSTSAAQKKMKLDGVSNPRNCDSSKSMEGMSEQKNTDTARKSQSNEYLS